MVCATVGTKLFHPECLKCFECQDLLQGAYKIIEENVYCDPCGDKKLESMAVVTTTVVTTTKTKNPAAALISPFKKMFGKKK